MGKWLIYILRKEIEMQLIKQTLDGKELKMLFKTKTGYYADSVLIPEDKLNDKKYIDGVIKKASKKESKYKNKKTEIDGIRFDSIAESRRYLELKAMERAGEISDLKLQPRFDYKGWNGKLLFFYKADFQYYQKGYPNPTIEDVKGMRTPIFNLKKKLIEDRHNITIEIVR